MKTIFLSVQTGMVVRDLLRCGPLELVLSHPEARMVLLTPGVRDAAFLEEFQHERLVIVVSPVLATANLSVAAVDRLKERGANDIRVVSLIASPEGIERMRGIHPDVPVWLAAIDEGLDKDAFIVPGLGDAGDRAYGTR